MPNAFLSAPSATMRMFAGFIRFPVKEKILLILAWCLIGLSAACLRLIPFRTLAPLLGEPIGAVAFVPVTSGKQVQRARTLRCAILRAVRIAPFRSDCLPQAFAAALMCRIFDVPASVHLGLRLEDLDKKMAAHAWVCSGPVALTGGRCFGAYIPVACFCRPKVG